MATLRQDFDDNQKSALVQLMLTGGLRIEQACELYGLSTEQLEDWVCQFRRAVRQALDHQLRDTLSIQGLELDELSRPEFSGNLLDIGVDDLLQTIQMGRKDAHLIVTHSGEASEIWCRGGEVVDARSGSLTGAKAFHRILAIERGNIVADFARNHHARRIQQSTPRLLLEAASSRGLRARLMQRIGDPALIFTVNADLTSQRAASFKPDELDILSLFDGKRSVEEIILMSGLRDARALEIVAHFREQQLIVPCTLHSGPLPAQPDSRRSVKITMSDRPFVASAKPEPARLPAWWLASGAVLCSSLGAVAAIAYASAESSSPQAVAPTPPDTSITRQPEEPAPPSTGATSQPEEPAPVASALAALPGAMASGTVSVLSSCPKQMLWIEAGEFTMGTDSKRPALSLAYPQHRVSVSDFCIGKHEVTVAEYRECSDAGDCTAAHQTAHFAAEAAETDRSPASIAAHGALCNAGKPGRDAHPINCISHAQAAAFCKARGVRLPTEAEWEFAARGPSSRAFPWGDAKPTRSRMNACGQECKRWYTEHGLEGEMHGLMYPTSDGYAGTAPVGSFPLGATPDGVEDLIGNVFEWTAGGFYDYGSGPQAPPHAAAASDSFIIRGGNFNSGIREFADPALRFAMHGESYSQGVGFRCAADVQRVALNAPATSLRAAGRAGDDRR
jgi:formylglycine-generating enzyme required for sulfatase activity